MEWSATLESAAARSRPLMEIDQVVLCGFLVEQEDGVSGRSTYRALDLPAA